LQELEGIIKSPEMSSILQYNYDKINNITIHNSSQFSH
jgi:hypothetical protein